MRIALFSDVYKPVINGVVNHVSLLKKHFEQRGEQVWLFVPGSQRTEFDERNVICIPGIPIADTGYHLSVSVDQRSRNLLKQMDVIHVHHPFLSGSFGLTFSRRFNIPLVFTNHTRYDLYVQQYLPLVPEALSETALHAYFQLFSQRCSAMIAPSESVAKLMREWGIQSRIVVIPNGIELDEFYSVREPIARQSIGLPPEAVVGIYVGRMSGEKSISRLLQVFAVLAEEDQRGHLLLVGGGPDLESYRRLVQEFGLERRVTFTGQVPYAKIASYLHLADFFVSASVSEVHPLTFIEAAATGLPAVGIASPGVTDMIIDGETGFVAKDNDFSLGLRMLDLIQGDQLRRQMGEQARQYSQRYAAHHNARQVLTLYQDLVRHL